MPLEVQIITERTLVKALTVLCAAIACASAAAPARAARVYVANSGSGTVTAIDGDSGAVVATIPVGIQPRDVAITPDGRRAYVVNGLLGTVSVIDTATNATVGQEIPVGDNPSAIAISPDGSRAYVTRINGDYLVSIDTATNSVSGAPIAVGIDPIDLAVAPDGSHAYVVSTSSPDLSIVDLVNGTPAGTIPLGRTVNAIAITPDGGKAYLSDGLGGHSIGIDLATKAPVGGPLDVGSLPAAVAITPDGARAYMPRSDGSQIATVVGTPGNTLVGAAPAVGLAPAGIAIAPSGTAAFVADDQSVGLVRRIDLNSNFVSGAPVAVGANPKQLAIVPDQGPAANFTAKVSPVGARATHFDATGSHDPDGQIARYDWDFGDGSHKRDGGPLPSHQYWKAGHHTVKLTVTDDQGTSSERSYTGQTMSRNGGPQAHASISIKVPTIVLRVGADPAQRFVKRRAIAVTARCPDIPCDVTVSGSARRASFRRAARHLAAGRSGGFKLKLPRRQAAALRRALSRGGSLKARIAVRASTPQGDVVRRELTVRNRR